MLVMLKLVPTAIEKVEWYFKSIYKRGSLHDVASVPVQGADPGQHTITGTSDMEGSTDGTSDMEGPSTGTSDTEGSELEASSGTPTRNR